MLHRFFRAGWEGKWPKPTMLSWKTSLPSLGNKSYNMIFSNSLFLWCIQGRTNRKMLFLFCPLFFSKTAVTCTLALLLPKREGCSCPRKSRNAVRGERKKGRARMKPSCFVLAALMPASSAGSGWCHFGSYTTSKQCPSLRRPRRAGGGTDQPHLLSCWESGKMGLLRGFLLPAVWLLSYPTFQNTAPRMGRSHHQATSRCSVFWIMFPGTNLNKRVWESAAHTPLQI